MKITVPNSTGQKWIHGVKPVVELLVRRRLHEVLAVFCDDTNGDPERSKQALNNNVGDYYSFATFAPRRNGGRLQSSRRDKNLEC